jgi:hypothetical protein
MPLTRAAMSTIPTSCPIRKASDRFGAAACGGRISMSDASS